MAPSVMSPKPTAVARKGSHIESTRSTSREATPTASSKQVGGKTAKAEVELATVFKSDLTSIRNLVTCSICDQLLYEPFTLACGHTYCYSCLCNWFVPNRRKKTCPECRSRVKDIPAPAFMIKQIVETFTKRVELMPADESVKSHTERRAEEIAAVEKDRNSAEGLFKGLFAGRRAELWMDDEDGVLRCPTCGHEHEGGPSCEHCGTELNENEEGYSFSDVDDDDLDDLDELELDLDAEVDAEFEDFHAHHHHHFIGAHGIQIMHFPPAHFRVPGHHHPRHPRHPRHAHSSNSNSEGETTSEDRSEDDSEDENSLQDFVVPDDESPVVRPRRGARSNANQQQPITISDDESDEGGPITNGRSRRTGWIEDGSTLQGAPVLTVTDESTNGSEAGDMTSEAEMLRHAGWSPLDQGDDSEAEGHSPYHYGMGYEPSEESDESDTDTMVGNEITDDEAGPRRRERFSRTPTFNRSGYPDFNPYSDIPNRYQGETSEDERSEAGVSSIMDRDGDTEMSVSPRASRGLSLSTTDYDEYPESRSSQGMGEELGDGLQVHQAEDDSSDSAIRPPPRRRRRPRNTENRQRSQEQQTTDCDPRIRMILAQHQSLRGSQSSPVGLDGIEFDHGRDLSELDEIEVTPGESSRNHESTISRHAPNSSRVRRSTSYRLPPARNLDPLRSSRSPAVTRIISSTHRATRVPRQYVNTYHN